MTYTLSMRSLQRLNGVHPDLVAVVEKAIHLTSVDFGVVQGLRTKEEQAENVAKGVSQTTDSRHLTGHAVDVAAYEKGALSWDSALYIPIAEAFRSAALQLKVPIRWGASWQVFNADTTAREQVNAYLARKKKEGKRPFLDWGHFELC